LLESLNAGSQQSSVQIVVTLWFGDETVTLWFGDETVNLWFGDDFFLFFFNQLAIIFVLSDATA